KAATRGRRAQIPEKSATGVQGLREVGENVVDMLNADRQADHVFRHAGCRELFRVELAVRGRGRVAGERLGVADVHQTQNQLQGVNEPGAGFAATLDAEGQNAGGFSSHVFL